MNWDVGRLSSLNRVCFSGLDIDPAEVSTSRAQEVEITFLSPFHAAVKVVR